MGRIGILTLALLCASCLSCEQTAAPPRLTSVVPSTSPGGLPFSVTLHGSGFGPDSVVHVQGAAAATRLSSPSQLHADIPAQRRGTVALTVVQSAGTSEPVAYAIGNSVVALQAPGRQLVQAGQTLELALSATDFDGDPVTFEIAGLPAGATFDAARALLRWATTVADAASSVAITVTASDGIDATRVDFVIDVVSVLPPFSATELAPSTHPGNVAFILSVRGENFTAGDIVSLDDVPLPTRASNAATLSAEFPARPRGRYAITVTRGATVSAPLAMEITNSKPIVHSPGAPVGDEDTTLTLGLAVEDPDGDELRTWVIGAPPGAIFDESTGELSFTPDFIQGGATHELSAFASDGVDTASVGFTLTVRDTIAPPWPVIRAMDVRTDHVRLTLDQTTNGYLGGATPRTYTARVVVPTAANEADRRPVRVFFHGFGGSPYTGGEGDQFRIYPHDPDNTYWWGHRDGQQVPPFTQRRALHLLEWVLKHYPGADPERVYTTGGSMGGTGAATVGLLNARHFAAVEATIGQMVPRNHRPSRIAQLSGHWGAPAENLDDGRGMRAWDRMDLTRAVADDIEARNQFVFTRHGKDDPTIHFGAVTHSSLLTMQSWYTAIQLYNVGHVAVWDEGGHGPPDPVLGSDWWGDWSRIFDEQTFLRRNLAFIAFSNSSADDEPGDGAGNGNVAFDENSGYAASIDTPGDTGWNGDIAGTLNRYLRWDSRATVDTWARFSVPLIAKVTPITTAPQAGYPPRGDEYAGRSIDADVTVRRVQAFFCRPGEPIVWGFGATSGTVRAGDDGAVTIPQLPISDAWTTLVLTRSQR